MVASTAEREMLLSAIQRNGVDISQLASSLNCSVGRINDAIGQVATQICNLTGQVGMSSQQIINSVQFGNSQLANQIANCCCDLKSLLQQLGCNIEKTIMGEGSATRAEIAAARNDIKEGQRAQEMREMQREIDALRESKSDLKTKLALKDQNDFVQATVNAGLQPLYGAIQKLQSDVDGLKCKMPPTVSVPWPQLRAYNPDAAVAAQWAAQQYGNKDCGCH